MKFFYAFLLCLLSATHVMAEESPRPARIVPLATKAVFLDIAFAGDALIAVGERGIIIRSTDKGASWTQIPTPVDITLTSVAFPSANVGFVVGHESTILKTEDGGVTWRVLRFKPEEEKFYLDVWFADSMRGHVLGTDGELWTTSNGGETWSLKILAVEDWYQNHLFGYAQTADGTAVIAAERGGVFARPAGQSDWKVVASPYEGTFFGVQKAGGNFLLYGMSGKAYLLKKQATEWQEIDTGTDQFLLASTILPDSGNALVVGRGGLLMEVGANGKVSHEKQRHDRIDLTAVVASEGYVYLASMKGGVERMAAQSAFASENNGKVAP
mgnify:CR=1 FL=1